MGRRFESCRAHHGFRYLVFYVSALPSLRFRPHPLSSNCHDVAKCGYDVQAGRHARAAGYRRLYQRARILHRRSAPEARAAEQRLSSANRATAARRLHWRAAEAKLTGRQNLAAFDFPSGSLVLTEAGTKHRASLHVLNGEESLRSFDAGGIDIFSSDLDLFRARLTTENHTLKRALTDPRLVSGVGNAYSDEILHAAQLSPVTLTNKMKPEEWERLFAAARHTIELWVDRLRAEAGSGFPEKVTAFRKDMAVHGRYGEPCPRCGDKVLRIRYADNETNYCPRRQTDGKALADRGLS